MAHPRTLRIIRQSAGYDLLVTAPFALPWTAGLVFDGLAELNEALGLGGVTPAANDVVTVMFANLMGSIVVVWAVFRIARPTIAAGVADTAARVLFSLGMTVALINGASALIGVLLTLELVWALVQGFALLPSRRQAPALV